MNTTDQDGLELPAIRREHRADNARRTRNLLAVLGGFVLLLWVFTRLCAGAPPPPQRNGLPPALETGAALGWTNFCVGTPGVVSSEPTGLTVQVRYSATCTVNGRTPLAITGTRAGMVTVYWPVSDPPRRITFTTTTSN